MERGLFPHVVEFPLPYFSRKLRVAARGRAPVCCSVVLRGAAWCNVVQCALHQHIIISRNGLMAVHRAPKIVQIFGFVPDSPNISILPFFRSLVRQA